MKPKYRAYIIAEKRYLPVVQIDIENETVKCFDAHGGETYNRRHPVYSFNEIVLEQYRCSVEPGVEVYDGDILSDGDELIGTTGIVEMVRGSVYIGDELLGDFMPLDGKSDKINAIICGHVHESEGAK